MSGALSIAGIDDAEISVAPTVAGNTEVRIREVSSGAAIILPPESVALLIEYLRDCTRASEATDDRVVGRRLSADEIVPIFSLGAIQPKEVGV